MHGTNYAPPHNYRLILMEASRRHVYTYTQLSSEHNSNTWFSDLSALERQIALRFLEKAYEILAFYFQRQIPVKIIKLSVFRTMSLVSLTSTCSKQHVQRNSVFEKTYDSQLGHKFLFGSAAFERHLPQNHRIQCLLQLRLHLRGSCLSNDNSNFRVSSLYSAFERREPLKQF